MTAPRLHVLTATDSPAAVILRRGPSREVATVGWNRATGELQPGQWLRGRIHEFRSDLSPDGRHLIVFAGRGGTLWWTAISRAPWLTALAFLPQSSAWGGGGAFTQPGRVWLNGGGALPPGVPRDLRAERNPRAYPSSTDGFHMGPTHAARMVRRGWVSDGVPGYDVTLSRALPGGWTLVLRFALSRPGRAMISNSYALAGPDGQRTDLPDWEWAEPWGEDVQFAAGGALHAARIGPGGTLAHRRTIADLSDMRFVARAAPYSGRVPR